MTNGLRFEPYGELPDIERTSTLRGFSAATICQVRDWRVGDLLEASVGLGSIRMLLTGLGPEGATGRLVATERGALFDREERLCSLSERDWRKARQPHVYLAGPPSRHHELAAFAWELEAGGCRVTSSWLTSHGPDRSSPQAMRREAQQDLADVLLADVVVLFTRDPSPASVDHHIELGVALTLGKRVIRVGPARSGHQVMPEVESAASVRDVLQRIWADERSWNASAVASVSPSEDAAPAWFPVRANPSTSIPEEALTWHPKAV